MDTARRFCLKHIPWLLIIFSTTVHFIIAHVHHYVFISSIVFMVLVIAPSYLVGKLIQYLNAMRYIDPMTGLYNRLFFNQCIQFEAPKKSSKVIFAMMDLDNFKAVNDTKGHLEGDMLIREISDIIINNIGRIGEAIRYGGDEFCVIFHDVSFESVVDIMEYIRKTIECRYDQKEDYPKVTISISIVNMENKDFHNMVKLADDCLYNAKKEKNKIMILQ